MEYLDILVSYFVSNGEGCC